jgi:hypothetical protein
MGSLRVESVVWILDVSIVNMVHGSCEATVNVLMRLEVEWMSELWGDGLSGSECIWANTEYIHAPLFGIILVLSAQIRKQNWQSDYYLEPGLLKTLGTCTRSWRRIFVSCSTIYQFCWVLWHFQFTSCFNFDHILGLIHLIGSLLLLGRNLRLTPAQNWHGLPWLACHLELMIMLNTTQ